MYHLFAGRTYYPQTGERDYVAPFTRLEDAQEAGDTILLNAEYDGDYWYEMFDWYCVLHQCADGYLREVYRAARKD